MLTRNSRYKDAEAFKPDADPALRIGRPYVPR